MSKYVEDIKDVALVEFTINQDRDFITAELHKMEADLIGFSTYIWNLNETLEVCQVLKIANPNLKILLGGPEVTFDGEKILKNHPYIDFIIYGEGEESFRDFLSTLDNNRDLSSVKGLIYREGERIIKNQPRPLLADLNQIPSPYEQVGKEFKNRIVYYESSRGCPFNCQFCLSSTIRGVRYFNIERVKKDLSNLIEGQVRQVKFIDRTFNANKRYAMEIMQFIMDKDPENINFHFEVTAHLIDHELLDFISQAKEGLFQFEIGVQSTKDKTIEAIGRTTDLDKLKTVVRKIKSFGNIHQHLDLIAGLPYESYERFKKSFNEVYDLKVEKVQLGFLKLLKGSGLRNNQKKYGYKYLNKPPYEIISNNYISYSQIIRLKGIEDLVEKYYNGGYFEHTLEFLIRNFYQGAFDFYEDLLDYWEEKSYHKLSHSRKNLYKHLKNFIKHKGYKDSKILFNLLKYDFLGNNPRTNLPSFLETRSPALSRRTVHQILKEEGLLNKYLPEHKNMATKKLINQVQLVSFDINILELIDNGYNPYKKGEETFILLKYMDGQINRYQAWDITELVKELI